MSDHTESAIASDTRGDDRRAEVAYRLVLHYNQYGLGNPDDVAASIIELTADLAFLGVRDYGIEV